MSEWASVWNWNEQFRERRLTSFSKLIRSALELFSFVPPEIFFGFFFAPNYHAPIGTTDGNKMNKLLTSIPTSNDLATRYPRPSLGKPGNRAYKPAGPCAGSWCSRHASGKSRGSSRRVCKIVVWYPIRHQQIDWAFDLAYQSSTSLCNWSNMIQFPSKSCTVYSPHGCWLDGYWNFG